ncbi:Partner of Y14-MAGO isoform 1 [Tripterygium wilfordii]|uniref:Partner of Y14-MAGO isoform 1 n=1 Tax=Tripterygium wilfordii TaxID=458696 RepID=A0A7J7DC37_TRIWF|nr:partner of Y14 and mago-like [Tripterygium wilfordii]KAF5743907.1 Partner of Y14-MAGO isoform 1 [Tripterygium wilfordii]
MASSSSSNGETADLETMAEVSKTLKEGERILAPTRRPDGTLRRPIRIRAGYVPQDEVAIYQSKGALWKKEMAVAQQVLPGYDPAPDAKPKTKSVKRNERKKEKRLQASLDKSKKVEAVVEEELMKEVQPAEDPIHGSDSLKSLASQMNELAVSSNTATDTPLSSLTKASDQGAPPRDIDKKIRALKKKIRLAESQQPNTAQQDMRPEQLEKLVRLEGWREDLRLLECKKAEQAAQ